MSKLIVSDDELLYCLAAGITMKALGRLYGDEVGWARAQVARLSREYGVEGRASDIKLLVEAVRRGLQPPGEDQTDAVSVQLRSAWWAISTQAFAVPPDNLPACQSAANGFTFAEINKHPKLFGSDTPLKTGVIWKRCQTLAEDLGLANIGQLILVLLWAEKIKLPPASVVLNANEKEMARLSIVEDNIVAIAEAMSIPYSTVLRMRDAVCSKLRVSNFAQALIVALGGSRIELPDRLAGLAAVTAAEQLPADEIAAMIDFIDNYSPTSPSAYQAWTNKPDHPMARLLRKLGTLSSPLAGAAVLARAGFLKTDGYVQPLPAPRLVMPASFLEPR